MNSLDFPQTLSFFSFSILRQKRYSPVFSARLSSVPFFLGHWSFLGIVRKFYLVKIKRIVFLVTYSRTAGRRGLKLSNFARFIRIGFAPATPEISSQRSGRIVAFGFGFDFESAMVLLSALPTLPALATLPKLANKIQFIATKNRCR